MGTPHAVAAQVNVPFTSNEQLDHWFGYHKPGSPAVVAAHEVVRESCRLVAAVFQEQVPEGPDKTVAFRKLVEAMWAANAAIACNHPDNKLDGVV